VFWDRFEFLFIANVDEASSKVNWISPGTRDITDPGSTAPTFTRFEGWTGDGSSDYLSTSYNPTDDGTNYTQNSASIGVYLQSNILNNGCELFGTQAATYDVYITERETDNYVRSAVNMDGIDEVQTTPSVTDNSGLWIVSRTSSTAVEMYCNYDEYNDEEADESEGLPTTDFMILYDGAGTDFSANQITLCFAMDGLSDTEAEQLTRLFEDYLDKLGVGVDDR
jgi:hypothetical protein